MKHALLCLTLFAAVAAWSLPPVYADSSSKMTKEEKKAAKEAKKEEKRAAKEAKKIDREAKKAEAEGNKAVKDAEAVEEVTDGHDRGEDAAQDLQAPEQETDGRRLVLIGPLLLDELDEIALKPFESALPCLAHHCQLERGLLESAPNARR